MSIQVKSVVCGKGGMTGSFFERPILGGPGRSRAQARRERSRPAWKRWWRIATARKSTFGARGHKSTGGRGRVLTHCPAMLPAMAWKLVSRPIGGPSCRARRPRRAHGGRAGAGSAGGVGKSGRPSATPPRGRRGMLRPRGGVALGSLFAGAFLHRSPPTCAPPAPAASAAWPSDPAPRAGSCPIAGSIAQGNVSTHAPVRAHQRICSCCDPPPPLPTAAIVRAEPDPLKHPGPRRNGHSKKLPVMPQTDGLHLNGQIQLLPTEHFHSCDTGLRYWNVLPF